MDSLIIVVIISVLGPVIGSLLGVMVRLSENITYHMLSFAAGIMLSISFLELIPESLELTTPLNCIIGIIIGTLLMFILDKAIPHIHPKLFCERDNKNSKGLNRTVIYLILGIFMHNFPEGMAIALGTVIDSEVTFAIALAIAIHNIPEGICTSAPYYQCTGRRLKAFLISSSTAVPILVGFIVARYIFQNILLSVAGIIVAATAGLMIYICTDELIPASCSKVTNNRSTVFSLILGILFVIFLGVV